LKTGICGLNCKPSTTIGGEPINLNLKDHALEAANWKYHEIAKLLHHWAEIFTTEFHLGLPVPAIQVDTIARHTFGTYRQGRNGLGLNHEITINTQHLGQPLSSVLCTLFHELLHEWQLLYGRPGRGNYHNRQFKQKASLYGLIIDNRGYTLVEPGRFTALLAKHAIDSAALPTPENKSSAERPHGNSKMRKYRCQCTTVRCAVELFAHCDQCGQHFMEAPPSW
jgi:hypothetical protein